MKENTMKKLTAVTLGECVDHYWLGVENSIVYMLTNMKLLKDWKINTMWKSDPDMFYVSPREWHEDECTQVKMENVVVQLKKNLPISQMFKNGISSMFLGR